MMPLIRSPTTDLPSIFPPQSIIMDPPVRIKPTVTFTDADHASFVGYETFTELG